MGVQIFKGAAGQRARLVGRLNKLQAEVDKNLAEIAATKDKIAAYNLVLQEQGIDLLPEDLYGALTPTPKRRLFKHGQLSALILESLRVAQAPLSTLEIMQYAVEKTEHRFQSAKERYHARKGVKDQLRVYAAKGFVVRLTEGHRAGFDIPAVWALPEFADRPHVLLEGQA